MNQNMIAIAATNAKVEAEVGTTLDERLWLAMKCTSNHWMVTDEESQFMAAVTAVHGLSDAGDKARIEDELKSMRQLAAIIQASQTGLTVNIGWAWAKFNKAEEARP